MTKLTKDQLRVQEETKESRTWGFENLVVEIATKKLEIERIKKDAAQIASNYNKKVNEKQLELNKLNRLLKYKKSDLEKKAR